MSKSKNSHLFSKFLTKMNILKREKAFSEISDALQQGKNSYMRLDLLESSNFDMVWIKKIEDCIYDLGEIIANPREVTKTVTSIVPVELAKKTGSESVIHLASHTQYIKDVTPEGDVIPNKILNIGTEEDIHTYENRFIATLVRRLVLFVEKRYEFVKRFAPLHDEEILYFKNKSIIGGEEVEIETKIKVKSESETKMADTSNKYIDRILKIREYILFFYGSKFMKDFKTERDVRNPIVLTNILRKNPKYHKCYELYRFIERYEGLGVSYKVNENITDFSEQDMIDMNAVMLSNYLALKSKDKKKVIKQINKQYKPKILHSIDDEEFVYGDLLKGPIEFMRVDEGYKQYLNSQVKKDLPIHPTKLEKEYYAEEYQEKKDTKANIEQIEKLEKRKKKAEADFDKKAQAMVAQREKEEAERIAAEKEAARLEEEKRIEAIRQQLIEQAKAEHQEEPVPAEEPAVEEAPAEEPVQEEVQPEPVIEEPVQEAPVEEQPQEVEPQPEPEPEPQPVEEAPVVEEVPQEEPQPEEVVEEPVEQVQEEQPVEEPAVEEPAPEQPAEEPVQEEVQPEPEPVPEQPKKRKSKIVWVTFTDSNGKTRKVPQHIYDDEEPVVKPEPQPEPAPQPEPEPEPAPVVEEPAPVEEEKPVEKPKKKKSKIVWVTFTDSNGKTHKVPQHIVDEEQEQKPIEEPAPVEPEPAPVVEEPQEAPVEEQPQEEVQPEVEPEPQPQPEPVKEEPQENEQKEEISEEKPSSAEILEEKKEEKRPQRERKPKKEKPVKEEKQGPKLEPIPGRFIVKTNQGYYVKKDHYSAYKNEAWVFDDFNEANKVKSTYGGKVVKL